MRGSLVQLALFRRIEVWCWVRFVGERIVTIPPVTRAELPAARAESTFVEAIGRPSSVTYRGLADLPVRNNGAMIARFAHMFEVRTESPIALDHGHGDTLSGTIFDLYDTACTLDLIGEVSGLGSPELFPDVPAHRSRLRSLR